MKKLAMMKLYGVVLVSILIVIGLGIVYQQFFAYKSQPMVQLADQDQHRLQQYQRDRSVKHYEFKLQPRQSTYCAGRVYCIEQSTVNP
jgi:Tfp pilus assembly protein PilN